MEQEVVLSIPSIEVWPIIKGTFDFASENYPYLYIFGAKLYSVIALITIPAAFFMIIGIIYTKARINQIRREEENKYNPRDIEIAVQKTAESKKIESKVEDFDKRWKNIILLADSSNQNDWRRAIMDADILLEDLLDKLQYQGVDLGEKLRSVDRANMQNLDSAWEAHKVRNMIAHERDYALSPVEAKRVIMLYRNVFAEYGML